MFGSLTLTSPAILKNGGWKICPFKAIKCSCCNRDLNTSNLGLNIRTKKSLVTFLKPKEKLRRKSRRLIRSSSQKVLPRNGKFRLTLFKTNGKIGACKRRFSGDKNRGCSGLEKEKETQSFFIDQPWITNLIIEFQNLKILKGKILPLTKKWNMS
jgi:hypothetical protein